MGFWEEVQAYKKTGEVNEERAAKIIDTHLCSTAEKQVNIDASKLSAFAKKAVDGNYTYSMDMFDTACDVVFKMIQQDTFNRFKLTDKARELLLMEPLLAISDVTEPFSTKQVQ